MLTDLTKVKSFLQIGSITNFDTLLTTLISSITSWIVSQSGTILEEATVTNEIYNFEFVADRLMFRNAHVTSVTSLERKTGGTTGNPTYETVDADDYALIVGQDYIDYPSGFSTGINAYRVTYVCGFDPVPTDLELLATKLVARVFDRSKSQGKTGEAIDGASVNWQAQLDEIDKPTLSKYKNYSV